MALRFLADHCISNTIVATKNRKTAAKAQDPPLHKPTPQGWGTRPQR